jgi:hypothetical protein
MRITCLVDAFPAVQRALREALVGLLGGPKVGLLVMRKLSLPWACGRPPCRPSGWAQSWPACIA